MPLEDLRVKRIQVLIALAEAQRRITDEEAVAAATDGLEGVKPSWMAGRKVQLKSLQDVLERIAELIVQRLIKERDNDAHDLDEQSRAQAVEDDVEAKAASLLEMDREIASIVMSRASELKRQDYAPLIARFVAVDVSNEGPGGFGQALDELLGAQQ